jgi:hypothetical protein
MILVSEQKLYLDNLCPVKIISYRRRIVRDKRTDCVGTVVIIENCSYFHCTPKKISNQAPYGRSTESRLLVAVVLHNKNPLRNVALI